MASLEEIEALKITESNRNLLNEILNDRKRIPEDLFKRAGLPLLLCEDPEVDISVWVDIAGGAQNEVDVVNDAGKVLYTVPAIINTRFISKKSTLNAVSIDRVLTDNILKLNAGHTSKRFAKSMVLNTVSPMLNSSIVDEESLARWNLILKANNVGQIVATANVAEVSNNASSVITDEIEE